MALWPSEITELIFLSIPSGEMEWKLFERSYHEEIERSYAVKPRESRDAFRQKLLFTGSNTQAFSFVSFTLLYLHILIHHVGSSTNCIESRKVFLKEKKKRLFYLIPL